MRIRELYLSMIYVIILRIKFIMIIEVVID